jgi:hypothetical protein
MSESRTLQKNKLAEWDVIVDLTECNGSVEKAKEKLMESRAIKSVEIVRK